MYTRRTLFSQLMAYLPERQFRRIVQRYSGNKGVRSFSCWNQLLVMMFAQLTGRESLRDIELCLKNDHTLLYQNGIRGTVSRSTIADANELRPSGIYKELTQLLIKQARALYAADSFFKELNDLVYVLDSTYISLCITVFPWAQLSKFQGEVKIHTLLDLRGSIPSFIAITPSKVRDNQIIDELSLEPGAFYVMDRAYVDFTRLYNIHQGRAYFIVRPLTQIAYTRVNSRKVDKNIGLRCDQIVKLTGSVAPDKYHDHIRIIKFVDPVTKKRLAFMTNNFSLPAALICKMYKERWQIEIFFKWIKQNLKIKKFFGTSLNAVETQIWIAICTYLLVAIVKKKLKSSAPLYQILQFFSLYVFHQMPISQAFQNFSLNSFPSSSANQLELFEI